MKSNFVKSKFGTQSPTVLEMPLTIYYVLPPSRQRFVSSTEKMGVPFKLKVLPKTARSPQTVENLYSFFNVYYT